MNENETLTSEEDNIFYNLLRKPILANARVNSFIMILKGDQPYHFTIF